MNQNSNQQQIGQLLENQFLRQLAAGFPRHPKQLNALLESDAELFPLSDDLTLALTTDSIVEEIETGLYQNPFLIGWMTVMANLSDLAAVGARPIGLILLQHLPDKLPSEFLQELQKGISAACKATGSFILGGDTNTSKDLQIGATAIGLIEGKKIIMRRGCQVGDKLFASAKLGAGNAYAFSHFFAEGLGPTISYQPQARLTEGALVRQYGSTCIDTSDGFFPALANLIAINKKGFAIEYKVRSLVAKEFQHLADKAQIPAWFFLAGPHGEFELLFTIPSSQEKLFLKEAELINWKPIPLGQVTEAPALYFHEKAGKRQVNPFRISNLFNESNGQPKFYLKKLLETELYEKQETT